MSGIVGEKVHDFVLDTGACVCIVPESCVNEEEYLQDMLVVADANGHTERRRIAKKRLQIKGFDEEIEVAVAPDEVLGGKAIFSINLWIGKFFVRMCREGLPILLRQFPPVQW